MGEVEGPAQAPDVHSVWPDVSRWLPAPDRDWLLRLDLQGRQDCAELELHAKRTECPAMSTRRSRKKMDSQSKKTRFAFFTREPAVMNFHGRSLTFLLCDDPHHPHPFINFFGATSVYAPQTP